jgi:hypothetical protein
MGWSWNRQNQNHPERPLWPREISSPRPRHRAPVGALPPSPEQRDKVALLGKGVSNRHATRVIAGNSRPRRPFPAGEPNPPVQIASFGNLVATPDLLDCQS